jgi:hypothetical protein
MGSLRDPDPRQAGGYGPSLAAVVAAHGPLPISSVMALAAGLAQVLSAAHAAGVVYRELNPANVVLAADRPRLISYGGPQAAGFGQAARAWTLDFTSPEQAAAGQAGPASDIFSLGAVLLYAAAGNLMSHFAWHLDQLPGELRPVIERCMAADPARRPTATQLLTELTAAHSGAAGWPMPGTQTAGIAPYGSPTPYGSQPPYTGQPPYSGQTPYGVWPAQTGLPAAPFPAQAVGLGPRNAPKRPSRFAVLVRRNARLIVTAALAVGVAIAGTVYVVHPWPYPVLRPAGLTAGQRSVTSISLGWSNPTSEPLPDKYVILRNGAVAATVPGNVNHFTDVELAPAATYDYRVVAYRGSTPSQPSLDLRAATRTPPSSEAVFDSSFNVTEKLTGGGDSVTGDKDGDTWYDTWTFFANCALGPCVTQLSGSIDGEAFNAVLKPAAGGTYSGTVAINDYYSCGSSQTNYEDSKLMITVTPSAGQAQGTQWQATKFSGGAIWEIDSNPNGNCGSGSLVINLDG